MKQSFKILSKILIIFLLFFVVTFISLNQVVPVKDLHGEVLTATTILIVAGILVIAGYVFYSYIDMENMAVNYWDLMDPGTRTAITTWANELAPEESLTVSMSAAMLDSIYGIYDMYIAPNEFLSNALYNLKTATVEGVTWWANEFGNPQFINTAEGGGYYTSAYYFPSYDDLQYKHADFQSVVGGVSLSYVNTYGSTWAILYSYEGSPVWFNSNNTSGQLAYFETLSQKIVDSVSHHVFWGNYSNQYQFPNVTSMAVATMAINDLVTDYVCIKYTSGTTAYTPLWVPVIAEGDYVIDEPTDDRIKSGAGAMPIDIQYGTSAGIHDRTKDGADVLGSSAREVTMPIDIPYNMLGTTSSAALAGEWAGTTDYTDVITQEATTAELEWENLDLSMEEISIPHLIMQKFPFCIPFDLAAALAAMVETEEVPILEFEVGGFVEGGTIVIDLTPFQVIANIVKWCILIMFNIGLILLTRRIIRG